ncbi:hypothetical protein SX4_0265 [Vibrio mimicus SX-4]|nr:hypothetical protein SX4_0265 [Vibrio mimicus SX-4]
MRICVLPHRSDAANLFFRMKKIASPKLVEIAVNTVAVSNS